MILSLNEATRIGLLCGLIPLFLTAYIFKKRVEDRRQLEDIISVEVSRVNTRLDVKKIIMQLIKPVLPSRTILERMQINLQRAGLPYTPEEVYTASWVLAVSLGVFMALLQIPSAGKMIIFGGVAGVGGYMFPQTIIKARIRRRQRAAQKEILDFIDLVASGVEAGLEFGGAIEKVSRQLPGVLSEEFQMAFSEIELNRRRAEAFGGLAERLDVEDVSLLIDSIIQAEKTGVPMTRVLKDQAARIRQNYKTNALRMAQAASVKMLAPVILFIVPALFIVILGPPLLGIGKMLKF